MRTFHFGDITPLIRDVKLVKIKTLTVIFGALVVAGVACADELHDKAMASTHDLQRAISEMHVMQEEHGPDFGGHIARAEALARQAESERQAALDYYRSNHPGWQ
jgi:hypothetical protein